MASLKYEELKACLKKGGNTIGTLKLCYETFSKNDEAFHRAVDHMSFWCPQLFSLAFSECASTRILAVKCINLFMPKFVDRLKPFSDDWWKQLKQDITKKYAVLLAEKLDTFEDWDVLWKLCVSILDIELYQSTTLVNALLKVAEKAFRDKKLVITAFNCWKHFITVYAKSPTVMFSSKQISLLITPLTAKSHYTLKYCEIKLEVWNTLILLVVDKSKQAVDVIISPLLNFLYGPLKMPVASSFPELVDRSAESYLLVLNNPNVFKYINESIASYLPKVILSIAKSKKINEELILRVWKTFFVKVKQVQTLSLLDIAIESVASYSNELNEENVFTFMKLIEVFMAEHPNLVFKHLHKWILCDNLLSVKFPDDIRSLELIIKGYENDISQLELLVGHLFDVPLNFKRDDVSKWNNCLSNLSELWLAISDVIHLIVERNENKSMSGLLSSDLLLQLLIFPVECLYDKWCSRIMKHWRLVCNDSVLLLPASENLTEFGSRLIKNLIVTLEKHPKSLTSVVYAALEVCGILLSSIILKGNVKQAVPLITCIVKLIEQIESVPSRQNILLNEALPKISLWSNLHVELNTDLLSIVETIVGMAVIGSDVTSVKLKNKITKVTRLIRSNVTQSGAKNSVKEVPSTPKSAIMNSSFMHRLDKANRNRQSSNEDLRKLLSTPEKTRKEEDEYVIIPPKTKVTPLTKHQKEVMKSRKILPAMYNGLSQDTQSQDSQALDVILSVGGNRPVKRTLDSKNENAIDELLDELETKDDSIFLKQSKEVEAKQTPEVSELNQDEIQVVKTPSNLKDDDKVNENKPVSVEKQKDLSEDDTQKLDSESESGVDTEHSENESKKEICSKVMSLLKDECKKSDNNLGKFFNILINEPHPALYLFHKFKELAENSGDNDAEFQLICKEFSLVDLTKLFNALNAAVSNTVSVDTEETKKEVDPKGISGCRKSLSSKNRKSIKESSNSSENDHWHNSDSRVNNIDDTFSDGEKHSSSQRSDIAENPLESINLKKNDEPTSDITKMTDNELVSPSSRAKRKINPPKRYSPTRKLVDASRTPTKISPKLLRSRKSLTLPMTQSSPVRTKPRRSLNMKSQASALVEEKRTAPSSALKKKIPAMTKISEENLEKRSDSAQETVETCEKTKKGSTEVDCEPMDVEKSGIVCSTQESCKESEASNSNVIENCSPMLSERNSLETSEDSKANCDKAAHDSMHIETVTISGNDTDEKNIKSSCLIGKEKKSVDSEILNSSMNDLNESRDFTLTLVKTPKTNGDISMEESSPEIFNSVNLNETSDVFSIYGDIPQENKSKTEENDGKIDRKIKMKKTSSALKKKDSTPFKSAIINGTNNPSHKEKNFVSLDNWIMRSSKQSENLAKPVEFSQNSDIIESSQPDVPLSSFKQNKSMSVSSPIMTQFNSSIYCSPKSAVESEPNSGSKPKVARKLILNDKESLGLESYEKSQQEVINNENNYNESSKNVESDDSIKLNGNYKLSENTKVLSPRNQYLGRTALMMNMAIGDDGRLSTPSGKTVQKESSVTPSPPRTPQHLNSVGKKWVKRRYVSDAPPTPSILKKNRNDENDSRSKVKLVSFSDPPMIEVLEFSASDPQRDTVYGLDVTGLTENTPDDYSSQGSIPEMPEVSSTKICYSWLTSCRDPIDGLVPLLVEPKWHSALKEKFEAKNLKTIGCLAALTELQACQLPVGEPRLFRIKNALKEYHRNLQEKRKETEESKRYERSKFMCKFLMPAGIDKAIMKDRENPLKDNKEIDANEKIEDEDSKENNVSESSVSVISTNIDNLHEEDKSENVESRMSVDIVETSQVEEINEDKSSANLHAPSFIEEIISLEKEKTDELSASKEILSARNKIEDLEEESDPHLVRKQVSKRGVARSEACEEETSRNRNGEAVLTESETEKQEASSFRSGDESEQISQVGKDDVISTSQSSRGNSNQSCHALSSDSDLRTSLSVNGKEDLPSVSIEDKKCCTDFQETSAEPSVEKSIIEVSVEKSAIGKKEKSKILNSSKVSTFKEAFVCIEKLKDKTDEFEKICESSKLSEVNADEHEQTESLFQSTNSESDAEKLKGTDEAVSTSEVLHSSKDIVTNQLCKDAVQTEPLPTTCDETYTLVSPHSKESNSVSQKEENPSTFMKSVYFAEDQDKESNGTITSVTSDPKSVKTTPRLLRKRKATVDSEVPKSSKILRSSDVKKPDEREQKQVELSLGVKALVNKKSNCLQQNENSEELHSRRKSVTLTVENASTSTVTHHEIEVPVEYCNESSTSKSEAEMDEGSQNVCAPETSSVKKGPNTSEKLEDIITKHCKSKKELLRILLRDEDSSSCVALLKDAILNRVDVKRDLLNCLLNDEQLGVKFCVKF